MKIIGVIPARYQSSRFPGKPLADICGKPMIWWVYQQCMKVEDFDEVYVATDDDKIFNTCTELGAPALGERLLFAGKIEIFLFSLPLMRELFARVEELLS